MIELILIWLTSLFFAARCLIGFLLGHTIKPVLVFYVVEQSHYERNCDVEQYVERVDDNVLEVD